MVLKSKSVEMGFGLTLKISPDLVDRVSDDIRVKVPQAEISVSSPELFMWTLERATWRLEGLVCWLKSKPRDKEMNVAVYADLHSDWKETLKKNYAHIEGVLQVHGLKASRWTYSGRSSETYEGSPEEYQRDLSNPANSGSREIFDVMFGR